MSHGAGLNSVEKREFRMKHLIVTELFISFDCFLKQQYLQNGSSRDGEFVSHLLAPNFTQTKEPEHTV
jgi:hypothetical protein